MATKTNLNFKDIIKTAAEVALNTYGVFAIAKKEIDNGLSQNTKKGIAEEGVLVRRNSDNTFALDVYLVLAQGIKITETLRECQKTIKFKLDKLYPKMCREVNVYALDISAN
jgi:uncharacterized alkaline shock family protein YloU